MLQKPDTKETIFICALKMFNQYGYTNVSIKKIADKIGIATSSIFYHYPTKDDLLQAIFDYFEESMSSLRPDLDELRAMVGRVPSREILKKTIFVIPAEVVEKLGYAMTIASSLALHDKRAEELVYTNLVQQPTTYMMRLLNKMMEMDLIEPIDAESFARIHSSFCLSTVVMFNTKYRISIEEWITTLDMLFQLVKEK